MDGIPDLLTQAGGAAAGWSLAAGAVWMILTGRLVPRSTLQEQQRATADWRRAYELERAKVEHLLLPVAELQQQVLSSLPRPEHATGSAE